MTENKNFDDRPLHKIFTSVPPHYDLVNRLFSLRLDEGWRRKATRECLSNNPNQILDLCTGTGDLAVRLSRQANGDTKITGLDFSHTMLQEAEIKQKKRGRGEVAFIHGDAGDMPFDDNRFDTIGISFAFRNLTFRNPDTPKFLSEILRTLKPGGKFVIVESSQPNSKFLKWLLKIYMMGFVKHLGRWLSGDRAAYHYFAFSVVNFYDRKEVEGLLLKAGFSEVSSFPMTFGFAALHVAVK
jgi:demethylmenaquinone methyltransferase/2-methoxy-6-polyprenyl-1,4-benzoquinol methylase